MPDVSVIIPVLNEAAALSRCLGALARQTYPRHAYEVLVVDNGSTEDLGGVVAVHPGVKLLREPQPGSYAARNTGLAHARGDILAFTDGDCVPHEAWLAEGVAALAAQREAVAAVGGRIDLAYRGEGPRSAPELYESVNAFQQRRNVERDRFAVTANLIARRAAFDRVGLFDAELRSGGDLDWTRRLVAAGGELAYADAARVTHPARASWAELYRKTVRVARGRNELWEAGGRTTRTFLAFMGHQALIPVRAAFDARRDERLPGLLAKVKVVLATVLVRGVWLRETARSRWRHRSGGIRRG